MKKIAVLATYLGKVDRGAETFVIELVKQLSKDYNITIFSTGVNEELKDNIIKVNVERGILLKLHGKLYEKSRIYRRIVNRNYYFLPEVIFQKKFTKIVFENYINKEKYDILFPNNGVWGAEYASNYREKYNVPYIYTGHGGIGEGERLIITKKPDEYICLNKEHLKWAQQYTNNALVIHNGVNVNKFELKKGQNKKKQIISVAALVEFKRHHLTIEAVSRLDDVNLTILGRGELHNYIEDLGKKRLGDRFKLTSVPYEKISEYYQNADLFVLPSENEPFGIVYLEALASNLPIVAPDDEVRREIIGEEAGIYCDCEDIEEYSKAIEKALKTNWNNKPRQRAQNFEWEYISEKYKEVIQKLTTK